MRSWLLALLLLAACRSGDKADDDTDTTDDGDPGEVDADGDGVPADEDCDDSNSAVSPERTEQPYNGLDDDCDEATPDDDLDGDGHGLATDCDDGDPEVSPDADERCDGVDNDCDGDTDEDEAVDAPTWYADGDDDGYGDPDSTWTSCEAPPGYVDDDTDCNDKTASASPAGTEICDELDNDCDDEIDEGVTSTWYIDLDGDGFGDPATTEEACDEPTGYAPNGEDCDDTEATVNPLATELCDLVDNDCDLQTDEDDAADAVPWYADLDGDGYGDPDNSSVSCEAASGYTADDSDCDDTDPELNPDTVWYIDYDGDGYGSDSFTLSQCRQPTGYLRDDTDCDDTTSAANPGETEICDGLDNDCDGSTDEDDASDASTWYADSDGDGYGDPDTTAVACDEPSGYTSDDTDCDDTDASLNPDTVWYADSDGDGYGDAASTTTRCEEPSGYTSDDTDCDDTDADVSPEADEECDGLDNDCDGDTDEADAVDASTWYADSDADGYGDASSTETACEEPSGYVDVDTDCDDTDPDINPVATEVCDEVDNDCDGDTDEESEVYGDAEACAAESCSELLSERTGASDGIYWIDPDGSGAFEVTCDMSTDGGGWTLVVIGDKTEVDASDPPDLTYTSSVWTDGYGDAGDTTHISEAWLRTPSMTELMWIIDADVTTESGLSPTVDLADWSKTSGTIHLNELNSHSYGSYGGRIFEDYTSAICNTANASTSWGAGFGPVRSCQHSFGTLYYEMNAHPNSISTMELWIR